LKYVRLVELLADERVEVRIAPTLLSAQKKENIEEGL
jgi:hypothetical protein